MESVKKTIVNPDKTLDAMKSILGAHINTIIVSLVIHNMYAYF